MDAAISDNRFALIVVGLALAANMASVIGVWISGRQVRHTLRIERLQLFYSLRERVGSTEMILAVDALRSFKRDHEDDFVKIFVNEKRSGGRSKVISQVGVARRLFHRYIFDVVSAYETGALDRLLARRCLTEGIYYAYKHIDRPLSRGLYGRTRWKVEEIVDKLYATKDKLLEFDDEVH